MLMTSKAIKEYLIYFRYQYSIDFRSIFKKEKSINIQYKNIKQEIAEKHEPKDIYNADDTANFISFFLINLTF